MWTDARTAPEGKDPVDDACCHPDDDARCRPDDDTHCRPNDERWRVLDREGHQPQFAGGDVRPQFRGVRGAARTASARGVASTDGTAVSGRVEPQPG